MNDKDRIILQKINKHIRSARSFVENMDFSAFSNDNKTMSAAAFVIGQIGELAKEISPETQSETPQIFWKGIRGMRNRIVHDYENVDLTMLWDVITVDLPQLLSQIDTLL